jgi:hypothetical protein
VPDWEIETPEDAVAREKKSRAFEEALRQSQEADAYYRARQEVAKEIFLHFEYGGGHEHANDHFNAKLIGLIMKADAVNKRKLEGAYPLYVKSLREWEGSSDPWDFYLMYALEEVLLGGALERYYQQLLHKGLFTLTDDEHDDLENGGLSLVEIMKARQPA